jgi:hypothetical protein
VTVRATNLQNAPAGLPAEDHRLIRSYFIPTTSNGLRSLAGVLPAPAGYLGEVTLLGPESVRVNPARWVVPGTQSGVQGDYVVANDAPAERPIAPRDATLTRYDLLVVQVRDTAYTPNVGLDSPDVLVIPGTPALTGAAAPAVPPNAVLLGTFTVPPGAGTVTFAPTVLARQVPVGGIQPVPAGAAAPAGSYDGHIRDHSDWGLQRWSVAAGAWGGVVIDRIRTTNATDVSLTSTGHPFQLGPDTAANLAMDANQIQGRNGAGGHGPVWINVEEDAAGLYGDVALTDHLVVHGAQAPGSSMHQATEVKRLRITAVNDAQDYVSGTGGQAASIYHGFQIGPDNGANLIMDANEIMARDADGKVTQFTLWRAAIPTPAADNEPVPRGMLNGNSGLANQTAWQNMSMASRWGTFSGGPGAKWIFMNGSIYFSIGLTSATAWSAGANILTWSATFKPRYDQYFIAVANGGPWGEIKIEASSGAMMVNTAGGAGGAFSCSGTFVPIVVF